MKMAPGKADWPHTLADAISAEIVPWAGRGIGVCYTFPARINSPIRSGTRIVPRWNVSNVLANSPISTTTLAGDTRR
jgi:hypothetical protein